MPKSRISAKAGKPPLFRGIENFKFEYIPTLTASPLREETPLIFQIDAYPGSYIDLGMLKLTLGFRIVTSNGDRLDAEHPKVFPKSTPLYTLFQNVKIFWNHTIVYNSNFLYPWYARYILEMKTPSAQADIIKQTCFYYSDSKDLQPEYRASGDGGKMLIQGFNGEAAVPSWEDRAYTFSNSDYSEVVGPMLHDLQFQEKLLRDDVSIRMELTMAKPNFSLFAARGMSKDKCAELKFPKEIETYEYKVLIEKAVCSVPRAQISARYLPSPRSSLDSSYFFVQTGLQIHIIPKGTVNFVKQIISGYLPRRAGFL